jgi:predicted HD phosphohydrolase
VTQNAVGQARFEDGVVCDGGDAYVDLGHHRYTGAGITPEIMPKKVLLYVIGVVVAALATALAISSRADQLPQSWLTAALCMASLGFIAQVMAHRVRQATSGSIASIPYLAGVVLLPDWRFVLCILVVEVCVAAKKQLPPIKLVFNVAQLVLSASTAIAVYRTLGGQSLLIDGEIHVIPYVAAVVAFFFINTLAVSAVIALSTAKPVLTVWRRSTRGVLMYDVLASPLGFLFAWVYTSRGVAGAVFLAIPLLAVRQLFRTSWQLEQATQDLLQLMVKAIEARDPYTSGHSQRVQKYSVMIAKAAGLSTRTCERLGTAALLHDVGKIHEIYAPILRKPDKLTPEEWAIMMTHPIKSAELVTTVSHLEDLVHPIRHHHENWDGSGYPDRLVGEAIPYWARIITIADTIDAMTTDRPYRKALPIDMVRIELASMAGRQFDPSLCVTLLKGRFFDELTAELGAAAPASTSLSLTPARARQRIQGA